MKTVEFKKFEDEKEEIFQAFKEGIRYEHFNNEINIVPLETRVKSILIFKDTGKDNLTKIKFTVGQNCEAIFQCYNVEPISQTIIKNLSYFIFIRKEETGAVFIAQWYDSTYKFKNVQYFDYTVKDS